jgi:hypothetical protein
MLNNTPTQGWAITTSYNYTTLTGHFEIFDLDAAQVICYETLPCITASDNLLGLIAVCRACHLSVVHNYHGEIYVSNSIVFNWVTTKRFQTKFENELVNKMLKEQLPHLYQHAGTFKCWDRGWWKMKDWIRQLKIRKKYGYSPETIGDCPF